MINKNSFGISPDAPCSKHGITYPAPFETSPVQVVPLKINKQNADTKSPPKNPFSVQLALKSTLDIFYFSVPCLLHCLINRDVQVTKDEFKKYWDMITADKTFSIEVLEDRIYKGFAQ